MLAHPIKGPEAYASGPFSPLFSRSVATARLFSANLCESLNIIAFRMLAFKLARKECDNTINEYRTLYRYPIAMAEVKYL